MINDNEVLKLRMSGIGYPLIDRSVKELRHPSHKLFTTNHIVLLN